METPKDTCPICLEIVGDETSVAQPCAHEFCLKCITKWTDSNSACPLCLKAIDVISRKASSSTEEGKEPGYEVKVSPKQSRPDENEEFRELVKKIKEAEFSLKSQLAIRKKKTYIEKNYQLAMHMKQEVEMKLNFLARTTKISPRDLLGDIQHFLELLRDINSPEKSSLQNEENFEYYESHNDGAEDCEYHEYHAQNNVTKSAKNKKKSRNKQRSKKDEELNFEDENVVY